MQVVSKPDVISLLDRSTADVMPGGRGLAAWQALLRSHATLMRQLERDLAKEPVWPTLTSSLSWRSPVVRCA